MGCGDQREPHPTLPCHCARTVTRLYASLRAVGCSLQLPANIPVHILSIAERRVWPIYPPPGQNGQGGASGSVSQSDTSDRAGGPGQNGQGNVLTFKNNVLKSSTAQNLLITRLKRLLGPARHGLAIALSRAVDNRLLEEALSDCEIKTAAGRLVNPAGYLCKVVGYQAKGGRSDGKRKGPLHRAEPSK